MTESAELRERSKKAGRSYASTSYYGRGLIQLTGRDNYAAFSRVLGLDLVGNPGLAARLPTAATIFALWWFNPPPYGGAQGRINIGSFGFDGAFGKLKSGTDARSLVNVNDHKDEINANAARVRLVMKPDATYWTRTGRGGE